jgi:hypothetical protein
MNVPRAVCPQCRQEVRFAAGAKFARCPTCGRFLFLTAGPAPDGESGGGPEWLLFLKSMAYVILTIAGIIFAVIGIGVGVAFAGCALVLGKGMH